MLTHWAVSIPCKIIPVISLMKMKFSFLFTSRDFLQIVTAWWIQKCCVQLKLHLRVKAKFSPMGALLVQKQFWLQNLLQRNNLRPFHIMHQRYDHIMNIILLNVWRRYEFTWRDDNYQMNIRTHLFIPNAVFWLGKTDYFPLQ